MTTRRGRSPGTDPGYHAGVKASFTRSPRVESIDWGRMEIEGIGPGKDFKLFPGGGRPWNWTETGTHHLPGIQPADVDELLAKGSRVIVLSRGMMLVLWTMPETLALLEEAGVDVHVDETRRAVGIYNELAEREPIGGLFHSTC